MRYDVLKNKVVIVTGASSGIGLALAREFASHGAKTVLASPEEEKLKEIVANLKSKGRKAISVVTDVSLENDCKHLIDNTLNKFGRIDILVNNAGISMRALFEDLDFKVIRKVMQVNFWGTVYCSKYALNSLIQSKGSLVGITSVAGFKGLPGRTGYSASKFALVGFLETVRIETMHKGLHVMLAAPWFTSSNIRKNALGPDGNRQGVSPRKEDKMKTPEEVATKIIRGILKRKRTLLLTTKGWLFVFVNRITPRLLDWIVYNEMAKESKSPLKQKD